MAGVRISENWEMGSKIRNIIFLLLLTSYFLFSIYGCASKPKKEVKSEIQIPKRVTEVKPREAPELKTPDFIPAREEVSPLKTRLVSISARNTPLRDVLYVIAEAVDLNLVMGKGVVPETPITLTLKNVSVEDALNTVFAGVDYFYSIRNNMLIVTATETRVLEFGHPAITQTYSASVGGDILGGAVAATGGTSGIAGTVTQAIAGDAAALDFWSAMEKSITTIIEQGGAGGIEQTVTVNRLTGTIFVTATKSNLDKVERYINAVRRVINRQVIVEARIIEVDLSEGLKYGIDWSAVGRLRNVGSISLSATGFAPKVDQGLPNINFSITGGDFESILKALQQQGEVRTLSNPRINIMNGQTSLLSVGRSTKFISDVVTTTEEGVTTFTVTTQGILSGILLGIVPYINEYGEISMTITPIISDLVKLDTVSVGPETQQTRLSLPVVDIRELSTTVKVKDGEIVVIGGWILKKENYSENKFPLLGNIPVLGGLFKSKEMEEQRRELAVLLQPIIVSQ